MIIKLISTTDEEQDNVSSPCSRTSW